MARSAPAVRITAASNPAFIGLIFKGRPAWALGHLVNNGARGFRTIDCSATQLPFYIWQLRQVLGDEAIPKIMEDHAGAYPGKHARYFLSDQTIAIEPCALNKAKPSTAATVRASNSNSELCNQGGLNEA